MGCRKWQIFLWENAWKSVRNCRWRHIEVLNIKISKLAGVIFHPYANFNCPYLKIDLCDLFHFVGVHVASPTRRYSDKFLAGNKEAREGTARFLCRHSAECSHFIFPNTVCVTTLVYYTAYLAPLALFPCRGVSRRTDKRAVCNRSFDRASWTTSLKTSLSDGPGCWDPEARLLLCSSRRSETCGTEETGINEVSLSGACF